ncbi:MAG: phosphoribosylanthranilate isomerase [Anaerolineales bacterium]|nr:phosphoribosylanthranilate isomerase [Anaerolineales bacterium]
MTTRVKICGLTNLADARAAAEAGADMLGFIFHLASRRAAHKDVVQDITGVLRDAFPSIRLVGVFGDQDLDTIWSIAKHCNLDTVQLHGNEPPETVRQLVARGLAVIKAFRVSDTHIITATTPYTRTGITALLLDTYVKGQAGGTGIPFDWAVAREANALGHVIIAGGLTPDNVGVAIRTAQPWGVDVAGGVERAPGLKDIERMRHFIAIVRETTRERELH